MAIPPPPGLDCLVKSYDGRHQEPVRFPADRWELGLTESPPSVTALLHDERYTTVCAGHRAVTRDAIRSFCKAMDVDDTGQVLRAFVLIMAWGSGIPASRGIRNTFSALSESNVAYSVLSGTARRLRESASVNDLEHAYRDFRLAGVRRAFFTKWFSFAGSVPNRSWQPLILDSRVCNTLNKTLDVTTPAMANSRYWASRYAAYVDHLHQWADALTAAGGTVNGERLEWIFFAHNGKPLPGREGV